MVKVPEGPYKKWILKVAWWWYVKVRPNLFKGLSVFALLATFAIIWSESTFQFPTSLSLPVYILHPSHTSYFAVEVLSMMFVGYMCVCTYSSLLRLKLFEFCQMVPHHTDESSLLFVGAYLCKLSFPIMYNYLNMGGVYKIVI